MSTTKCRFSRELNDEFLSTLRERVNTQFKAVKESKYGNLEMVLKTVLMFSIYLVPLAIMFSGIVVSTGGIILLWVTMGIGMAGVGLCVMHDANHGVYSSNKNVNKWLGYSLNLIGSNAMVWKIQHNVLHHSYTNIDGMDDDISVSAMLRLSPNQERKWIHQYQHIYAWLAYCLMTLTRIFVTDFTKLFRYRERGLVKPGRSFNISLVKLVAWKVFYLAYILALPIILLPVSPWLILVCFVLMHFVTGFILAVIFQVAHIMPDMRFPLPDDNGTMENSWAVHELITTTNFAPRSRIFSWLIGGLNYQVEHHLFADVCHVHYKGISKIVEQTTTEFGLPYNSQRTFLNALVQHGVMLKELGRGKMAV